MRTQMSLDVVCSVSEDVVAREIDGEIVIVPIVAGIGDGEDEIYTLSETGKAVWQRLDGRRTLKDVASLLTHEFDGPLAKLEQDVLGFANELVQRGMLSVKP